MVDCCKRFLLFVLFTVSFIDVFGEKIAKRHGEDSHTCDDGKHGISIDLHGESDWKCQEISPWTEDVVGKYNPQCYFTERAYHVCIDQTIDNLYRSDIPHSGPHRKVWGQYGEYNYIPPGRYVHNLEHGGVVFMYHPCAPQEMVNKLRHVATNCLYRYILTAFPKLTKEYPFAVITYGCIFRMSRIDPNKIRQWIRGQFGSSPESDVYGNGDYDYGLLVPSVEPEEYNLENSTFCPDMYEPDSPQDAPPVGTTNLENSNFHENSFVDYDRNPMPTEVYQEETLSFQSEDLTTPKETQSELTEVYEVPWVESSATYVSSLPEKLETPVPTQADKRTTSEVHIRNNLSNVHNSSKESGTVNVLISESKNKFMWVLLSFVWFVLGAILGILVARRCQNNGIEKMDAVRVWSEKNSADSFSIAAVVRKIPGSFSSTGRSTDYHRLEANEQSSDEDQGTV